MSPLLVLWLWLPLALPPAHGQPGAKKAEGVDASTVAAYEKLGGVYGGVVKDRFGSPRFEAGKEAASQGLPGFRFYSLADGEVRNLPQVGVPFALDLNFTRVTDAGLKELAGLKGLSYLDLRNTKVTAAGMRKLQQALPKCRIVP
jgi:hypothetical protein